MIAESREMMGYKCERDGEWRPDANWGHFMSVTLGFILLKPYVKEFSYISYINTDGYPHPGQADLASWPLP